MFAVALPSFLRQRTFFGKTHALALFEFRACACNFPFFLSLNRSAGLFFGNEPVFSEKASLLETGQGEHDFGNTADAGETNNKIDLLFEPLDELGMQV